MNGEGSIRRTMGSLVYKALCKHDYSLSDGGHLVVESRPEMLAPFADAIHSIDEVARPVDRDGLTVAARVLQQSPIRPETSSEARVYAHRMGWELPDRVANSAIGYLTALGLVRDDSR